MDTRKVAAEYRLSHWAQLMRERKESGLSIKAYCENAGLHQNVYYYWQRKLREAAYEQIAQSEHPVPAGFAEVKLIELPAQGSIATASQLQIEVHGIRITTDNAYPVDRLAALLQELVRPC